MLETRPPETVLERPRHSHTRRSKS
jgi:hypothetical protein